jgi:predicted CopG family antitoxin
MFAHVNGRRSSNMVKVISLSDEAYRRLKALKRGKSFSETIIEIVEARRRKKKSISKFVGIWSEDDEYWRNFKKEIRKSRDKAKMREVKL